MTVLTTMTASAFFTGGAGASNEGGAKVKIQTLTGIGIKGAHYEPYMIIDVDEEDANLCVGAGKARFVVNAELAAEENARTRQAAGLDPLDGDEPINLSKRPPRGGRRPGIEADA